MDKDILVMGDFADRIEARAARQGWRVCGFNGEDEEMFKVLTSYGLKLPEAFVGRDLGSNLERNKRYDQILHFPQYPSNFTNAGNVLDFYAGGIAPLFPGPEGKGQARIHVPDVRPPVTLGADQHRH